MFAQPLEAVAAGKNWNGGTTGWSGHNSPAHWWQTFIMPELGEPDKMKNEAADKKSHVLFLASNLTLLEVFMWEKSFTIPELILLVGTRVALGAGLGLLIAGKISNDTRKGAAWALLAVGAMTTVPLAISLGCKPKLVERAA